MSIPDGQPPGGCSIRGGCAHSCIKLSMITRAGLISFSNQPVSTDEGLTLDWFVSRQSDHKLGGGRFTISDTPISHVFNIPQYVIVC
jgi:hypothetical protein